MDLPPTPPSPSLPPADWYPDPDAPGKLRYWDGSEWTEHRHSEGASTPDVDHFFKRTFSVLRQRWKPLIIIATVLGLPTSLLGNVGFAVAVRDWSITVNDSPGAEVISADGFTQSSIAFGFGLLVVLMLIGSWQYVAMAHQLHWSHSGSEVDGGPDAFSSLGAGFRRMWPVVGINLALTFGFLLAFFVAGIVVAIVPPVLILLLPLGLVFAVWAAVKVAFIPVAAVAPGSPGLIRASADVSATRFWPIFGRLALLFIVIIAIQVVGNIVTTVAGFGQEFQTFDDTVRFADFVPSVGASIPVGVISWVVSTAAVTIFTSGLVMLFVAANAGSRSEA